VRIIYSGPTGVAGRFETASDSLLIGRALPTRPDQLGLQDGNISSRHARLTEENGEFWIEDLGSTNGTWVDKKRIRKKTLLTPESSVRVGQTILKVEADVPSKTAASEASPPPESSEAPAVPAGGTPPDASPRGAPVKAAPEPPASPAAGPADIAPREPPVAVVEAAAPMPDLVLSGGSIEAARLRLSAVYDLCTSLGEIDNPEALYASLLEHLNRAFADVGSHVRSGLLVGPDLILKAFRPEGRPPTCSLTLARHVVAQKKGCLWQETAPEGLDPSVSLVQSGVRSAMYAPLIWKGEVLGVLYLDADSPAAVFDREDLRLLQVIATQAAMFIKNLSLQHVLQREALVKTRLLAQFPRAIAERLAKQTGRLAGWSERIEEVTALFADVRGFTKMTSAMEPDEVVHMLNDMFHDLTPIVLQHGGTVDKYVGDAMLAVFGSPDPDERQWEHAVQAAMEMQAAIRHLADGRWRGKPVFRIGVGIHTGPVIHGFIGAPERMDYTVIGSTINHHQSGLPLLQRGGSGRDPHQPGRLLPPAPRPRGRPPAPGHRNQARRYAQGLPRPRLEREKRIGIAMKCPTCQAENPSDSRFCHNCASPLTESGARTIRAPTFEVKRGEKFAGRYEIIEELGQGGMGKVFKAYDHKVNEVVALKLIRPEIGVNGKAIERFKNELKFARKISHRNICRMHDLGEEGFVHYITMEFVAGEDLKRFIRRAGPLSTGKTLLISKQVAEGLAEAHRLGVIHRDLKPQNVMIDQEGNAKIMDFGIARFLAAEGVTGTGVMIGTPEYMSPEQAELKEVDLRADIYSLGVVMYEMITGRVPFEGQTPLSIAMKHKTDRAQPVRDLNPLASIGLANIIARCMEKDPAERYQTIQELLDDLARAEQDLATGERVVSKKAPRGTGEHIVPKKAAKTTADAAAGSATPKKKLLVPVVALAVVVVAAIAIMMFLPKKSAMEPSGEAAMTAVPGENKPQADPVAPPSGTPEKQAAVVPAPAKSDTGAAKDAAKPGDKVESKTDAKKDDAKPPAAPSITDTAGAEDQALTLALARIGAAKGLAQKNGVLATSLFYRLAETAEQGAKTEASRKKTIDAQSLLFVAERLYRLSEGKQKDEDRIKALKKWAEDLGKEVRDKKLATTGDKSFDSAWGNMGRAAALQGQKDFENAAKACVEAAFLYKKILLSPPVAK